MKCDILPGHQSADYSHSNANSAYMNNYTPHLHPSVLRSQSHHPSSNSNSASVGDNINQTPSSVSNTLSINNILNNNNTNTGNTTVATTNNSSNNDISANSESNTSSNLIQPYPYNPANIFSHHHHHHFHHHHANTLASNLYSQPGYTAKTDLDNSSSLPHYGEATQYSPDVPSYFNHFCPVPPVVQHGYGLSSSNTSLSGLAASLPGIVIFLNSGMFACLGYYSFWFTVHNQCCKLYSYAYLHFINSKYSRSIS